MPSRDSSPRAHARSTALSLLAFPQSLGYTPRASSYRNLSARCTADALLVAIRFNLALRTDETHFFCSVAGTGSAIVDEIFEAVDGLSSARVMRCETRDHLPLLARVEKRQAGENACLRKASLLLARDRSRSRAARVLTASRTARTRRGSTEFQVNSSNRFSASAEVALPSAGHLLPEPREACFRFHTAEQLFVLSTSPAVGLPRQFISSLMRARLTAALPICEVLETPALDTE